MPACIPLNFIVRYIYVYIYTFGQIIATSAEVTPKGSLLGESSQNSLNSGLGIIVIYTEYLGNIGECLVSNS